MNAADSDLADTDAIDAFIDRWSGVTASEISTAQSFDLDLCSLLGVDPPTHTEQYKFERDVTFQRGDGSTSAGRIDLYKRGCFVLESKKLRQGSDTKGFDEAMLRARSQAERYARALPADEGRPPFVIVVDVGNRIELYSEFSRSGATYVPFPDPRSYRIALTDLRKPDIRERLRRIWTDPLSLDPSRASARVTREIAEGLAKLARSLEKSGHAPELVAQFLMRCLFTMFAEDVKLLPAHSFRDLLLDHAEQPDVAMRMVRQLWLDMDSGSEFSAVIKDSVLRFNGKLFKQPDILPLDRHQIALLAEAAHAKWQHVEPAIFGTLLERALSASDRHKLGAHYTPRAYVERLVLPTVIEPLRREWTEAQAAAGALAEEGKADAAVKELRRFHHRLCTVRVLDPACGSGNFLYVTLEHLKRLEGEVLNALDELDYRQTGLALDSERADARAGETVDPHNLLGIELNPRAAAIAEVVLWIGYLQWHFRTRGDVHPPQPVVRDFRNIENRDAVLAYDDVEFVTDQHGVPVTRWDGETMKLSPVTGEKVPDENARKPVERYVNPRKAAWPEADFVVGNPPFIGASSMRAALGDGYVDALRSTWSEVPESADFVMYWWHHAAQLTRQDALQRFGFITTNSIKQTFNRRVVELHLSDAKQPLSLAFAIPDHPWVDTADGAAVRIAMTVGRAGESSGRLLTAGSEANTGGGEIAVALDERKGIIHQDLRLGADVASAVALRAMQGLSSAGLKLHGSGFIVTPEQAESLGLGRIVGLEQYIRPYRNGRDLTATPRGVYVIDLFGLDAQDVRDRFPEVYQHLLERVKPERDAKAHTKDGAGYARLWWLHGKPRQELRKALAGLSRYIATVETTKHRTFQFLDTEIAPDNMLIAIALDDGAALGVLSSAVHVGWSLATGGTLEDRPRYNKSRCFETFPFPDLQATDNADGLTDRIRQLAEQLDAHRKRQQAAHPGLTLTGMYNVLDKLRSGEALTVKERGIHEQGLVSVLRQLHDELDAAVLDAYGWSDLLPILRVAHGNDASDSLLPFTGDKSAGIADLDGGAARRASHMDVASQRARRADEGARESDISATDSKPAPDTGPHPNPLPQAGEGASRAARDDARRAFDEAILERLVALNAQRAAEEARGLVRWLRPDFQNPSAETAPSQAELETGESADTEQPGIVVGKPQPWPKDALDQVRAIADLLAASPAPLTTEQIAARFTARGPWKKRLPPLLEMLVALGRAQEQDGHYVGGQ